MSDAAAMTVTATPGASARLIAGDRPYRSHYALLGHRVTVATNSPDFQVSLDRLNAEFRIDRAGAPRASYEVIDYGDGRLWEITCQGEELRWCDSLLEAVSHVEWHIVDQVIGWRPDLLHLHGAALAGPGASVVLPGGSGIGKTTFALALALRGLRLLSDDVVFIRPDGWRPLPFPRSPHVHDDALPRLAPLGLRYAPADHLGKYLCAAAFRPWPRRPGPPLRYLVFPELISGGPLELEPLSDAEAAVRLMRFSKNLRAFPRHGLDLLPDLLAGAACYVLRRGDDLAAAADLVYRLVANRQSAVAGRQ